MSAQQTLSVAMIARNEAENLTRSLPAVKFADEIIVVENDSTDETIAVAKSHGAKVISHSWEGYGAQRNYSIEHCRGDWILVLDADEVIPPELAAEIQAAIKTNYNGYFISYRNLVGQQQLRYGGWSPDYHLRLVRREFAHFPPSAIHETMPVPPNVGYLTNTLTHYTYRNIGDWLEKVDRYTDLEAPKRRFSLGRLIFKPPAVFLRSYFGWSGWRGGYLGLVASGIGAWYAFLTEIKRARKQANA